MKPSMIVAGVAAGLFLRGSVDAKTPVSELLAKPECPVALAHYQGGLGAEDQSGVIVAVWRDGTIVRAARADKPSGRHIVGRVGSKDLQALAALLARGDIWSVAHGEVGVDLPEVWLVLQQGDRRWAWWESPGFTRTRELQDTVSKLFRFHVESSSELSGTFERSWPCMEGQLEH